LLNPYTSSYAPNGFEQQNQQGLGPVFQNTNAQQQFLANQLRQEQQFSQTKQQSNGMGGINPMNLAKMLKNGQQTNSSMNGISNPYSFGGSTSNNLSAYTPWNQSSTASTYGTDPYSQQSIMLAQQDAGLSDSPWSGSGDWIGSGLSDAWGGLGNALGGIGDWFGGLFSSGGALEGASAAAEEAAPVAAAAL
jgi:hypothetical protein